MSWSRKAPRSPEPWRESEHPHLIGTRSRKPLRVKSKKRSLQERTWKIGEVKRQWRSIQRKVSRREKRVERGDVDRVLVRPLCTALSPLSVSLCSPPSSPRCFCFFSQEVFFMCVLFQDEESYRYVLCGIVSYRLYISDVKEGGDDVNSV